MNLFLFLDTCHVDGVTSELSLIKDVFVPLLSAVLGVALGAGVSYKIMLMEHKNQLEIEKEKEKLKNEGNMNFYKFNVSEIIEDTKTIKADIDNDYKKSQVENINFYPSRAQVQLPNLELILKSNIESHFISFLSDKNILNDFNKSFRSLMRLKRLIDAINISIEDYTMIYNETIDKVYAIFLKTEYQCKCSNNDLYMERILEKHSQIRSSTPKYYLNVFKDIRSTINPSQSEILNLSIEGLSQIENLQLEFSYLKSLYESFLGEYDNNIKSLKLISS